MIKTARSTREDKTNFISSNFPEVVSEKSIRTNTTLVKRIAKAMGEAGLYSPNTVNQPNVDSTIIRIIEKLQAQRPAAKK